MNHKPTIVNGVEYKTRKEAAKALGIPYQTFIQRLKKGTPLLAPVGRWGGRRTDSSQLQG